jgi:hypothetical protein
MASKTQQLFSRRGIKQKYNSAFAASCDDVSIVTEAKAGEFSFLV